MDGSEDQVVLDVLERLRQAGVFLTASIDNRSQSVISSETAIAILRDPDAYWADKLGIPVEQFRAYREFVRQSPDDLVCKAALADGRRCGAWIGENAYVEPAAFTPGVTDRCPKHAASLVG